jgi:hypothetical protein
VGFSLPVTGDDDRGEHVLALPVSSHTLGGREKELSEKLLTHPKKPGICGDISRGRNGAEVVVADEAKLRPHQDTYSARAPLR